MHEKCGVVGIAHANDAVARSLYDAMYALQHRGQEAAGIVTHDGFQQHEHIELGLVGDAFEAADLERLQGSAGIGHVRYPTDGSLDRSCAQPFTVSFKSGALALSHNGNLVNADDRRDALAERGHTFTSTGDTEVIAHELAAQLLEEDIVDAIESTMQRVHGSYSLTIMHDDRVMGVRDPLGNRPLCLGRIPGGHVLASESVALDTLGGELIREVRPGELIILDTDGSGYTSHQLVEAPNSAHCFFEWVYFARPDSTIEGRLVYEMRRELGRKLWAESGVQTDVVVPVPDSGRAFASGYAETATGVEFAEGLMKNRYVGRTFIMPTQAERERAVRAKLNPIKSTVEGKTVTLIDDSIVRGTTSRQLVQILRDAGATEVHLRIGSPPITAPCYMGIDMATRDELIAHNRTIEEIETEIGADSLAYLSPEAIADALAFAFDDLCMACVTGKYPYAVEGEEMDRSTKQALAPSD